MHKKNQAVDSTSEGYGDEKVAREFFDRIQSITPEEFEKQVIRWLNATGAGLKNLTISHLKVLAGEGGDFEIDGVAEFEIFGGASVVVLIECKRYSHPIERDHVMLLHAKVQDTNSNKGILFSTAPFRRGALRYAKSHNIATVQISNGTAGFRSRSLGEPIDYSSSIYPQYDFTGWFTTLEDNGLEGWRLLADDHPEALIDWLQDQKQ